MSGGFFCPAFQGFPRNLFAAWQCLQGFSRNLQEQAGGGPRVFLVKSLELLEKI